MNIRYISQINLSRALIWHKGGLEEWSAADWSNAFAGEAGEVCNAVKKLRRIEMRIQQAKGPHTREEAIAKIANEIGDAYLYLDLLAQRLGIDFSTAIIDTFNRVSVREGFPQRLALPDVQSLRDLGQQAWLNDDKGAQDAEPSYVAGFVAGSIYENTGELP